MANSSPTGNNSCQCVSCADLTMTCPKLHVIIIKWACL